MAFCLPLVLFLIFGTVEACSMIFLKQALTVASHEGARVALQPGSNAADVEAVVNQILADRRIRNGTISMSPSDLNTVAMGMPIEVRATAPAASNGLVPIRFYSGHALTAATTMLKEY